MARVSISKAAQLAGISRAALYKTYITQGKISVSQDNNSKKYIDTSELIRVFGEIKVDSKGGQVDSKKNTIDTHTHTPESRTTEIELLKQQLADAQQREQEAKRRAEQQEDGFTKREEWYQSQIQNLTDTMKLLEAPKQEQHPRQWWQFWK